MPATMEAPEKIEITNAGPIAGTFPIELDGPGVYELRGDKGSGKSTAIKCLELLAGHRVDLTVTDGQFGGEVRGFGVVAPIGKGKRSRGDLTVGTLDSEQYSVSDITDPPIKDAAKADAHSMRALASLTRTKADPAAYHVLVGGREKFEALVEQSDLKTDDPVVLANRIKSRFDAAARLKESQADYEEGHAAGCNDQIGEINLTDECDARKLDAAVDEAVRRETALTQQAITAERAQREVAGARETLHNLQTSYEGPTYTQAMAAQQAAENASVEAQNACTAIEKQIAKLRADLQQAEAIKLEKAALVKAAYRATDATQQHAKLIKQCETLIETQQQISPPEPAEVEAATAAVAEARKAQEHGVRVRDAKKAKERQDKHLAAAQKARDEGDALRAAAKGTFDVLAASIHLDGIMIESIDGEPRLIVNHPRRGRTLFRQLSDGERVRLVMDLASKLIPSPGIFPISQRLWQDLSPRDRKDIARYSQQLGICAFTAQVTDGPLEVVKLEA